MLNNNSEPISTDLLSFLVNYENAIALINHPVEQARYEKSFDGKCVEWSGVVYRIEDVSELGSRSETFYIDVIHKTIQKTPKNSIVKFTAYFTNPADEAKIRLDQEIKVQGTISSWNKFTKNWVIKDSNIVSG